MISSLCKNGYVSAETFTLLINSCTGSEKSNEAIENPVPELLENREADNKILLDLLNLDERINSLKSITNIGLCPTVKQDREEITIETNIFDFDSEIYQKDVIVELVGFIRKEKKFDNIDDLKSQILLDIAQAKF